jgi:hypothetical protein
MTRVRLKGAVLIAVAALSAGCTGEPPAGGQSSNGAASPGALPPATESDLPESPPVSTATPPLKDITFDTIKLALDKNTQYTSELLTPEVKGIDGTRVRVRGFILPSFQQSGLAQFVLVRDNQQCCFGPGALLHDCIVVDMQPGRTADFTVRPVAVVGTFKIQELTIDDTILAIYHLDGESVE